MSSAQFLKTQVKILLTNISSTKCRIPARRFRKKVDDYYTCGLKNCMFFKNCIFAKTPKLPTNMVVSSFLCCFSCVFGRFNQNAILKNMQFLRPQGHPFIKDVRLLLSLPLYVMPTFPGFHWAIIQNYTEYTITN